MEETQQTDHLSEDDPTRLFAELVNEVGVVRRLVVANDNSATLGEMMNRLNAMVEAIQQLANKPALTLTPDDVATRIAAAGKAARMEDGAAIAFARDLLDSAARQMESFAATAATVQQQRRRIVWFTGGGVFAGMILWSFLLGIVADVLPESWHLPERRAANILDAPNMWSAGERLMRVDNPQALAALERAAMILHENRETIEACERDSAQTKKPVRCTINISTGSVSAGEPAKDEK
jgi:hypothetical protein